MIILRSVTQRVSQHNNLVIRFWFPQQRWECVAMCVMCFPFCLGVAGFGSSFYGVNGWLGNWEQTLFCGGCMACVPLTWGFPQACCDRASCVYVLYCVFIVDFFISVKSVQSCFYVCPSMPVFRLLSEQMGLTCFQAESRIKLHNMDLSFSLNDGDHP